jgi:hypothetical protein
LHNPLTTNAAVARTMTQLAIANAALIAVLLMAVLFLTA